MPWLAVTRGDDKGWHRELKDGDSFVMGRDEECDVRLVNASASRKHCRIELKGSKLYVTDLGSSNGVKRDGKRYIDKTIKLKTGQHFEIGNARFDFMESYELYLEASKEVLDDLRFHDEDEMLENYAKMVAQVSHKRKKRRKKKGIIARLFGL